MNTIVKLKVWKDDKTEDVICEQIIPNVSMLLVNGKCIFTHTGEIDIPVISTREDVDIQVFSEYHQTFQVVIQ